MKTQDRTKLLKAYEKYKNMPRDNWGLVEMCLNIIEKELKQPKKQEIERLNVALEVNHSPILSVENKLNEVIEVVNKLLEK